MGYKGILISPLSDDSWVMARKSKQTMAKLITEDDLWIREWLEEWHPWSFEDGISERYAWIVLTGIPLKFWNETFIQWALAEDGILIDIDPNTKNKWRLDAAHVRIRTTKFKLIQKQITCQFGCRKFTIIITEDIGTSFREDRSPRSGSIIENFTVRPESSWAGSIFGETIVAESIIDGTSPKEVEQGKAVNAKSAINSGARFPTRVKRLEKGIIEGMEELTPITMGGCRFPRNVGKIKSTLAVNGEDKEVGHYPNNHIQHIIMGPQLGPSHQRNSGAVTNHGSEAFMGQANLRKQWTKSVQPKAVMGQDKLGKPCSTSV